MVRQQLNRVLETTSRASPSRLKGSRLTRPCIKRSCSRPSEDIRDNTVIAVGQTGYKLHDRVVRPAQVVVSTKNPAT